MIYQEINWIRSSINKLSPTLRKQALEWYRPFRHVPCFLQKYLKGIRKRFRKYSIIVQIEHSDDVISTLSATSRASGCKIRRELPVIQSFTTRVNAAMLEKLTQNEKVKKIWLDDVMKAILDTAAPGVKAPNVWKSGIKGTGVGVAILDTGIYPHQDISGRIVGFHDFINNKTNAYDDNGHGTHVSGCVAADGSQSGSSYFGTAPNANLIGVKVLDRLGSGHLSTVIQGIQWCIENRVNLGIRILNLSLGSTASQSYLDDPVCQAVEQAWTNGIVVCVAAGNEGPEPKTISSPGIDPLIITVGAIDDHNSLNPGDYFMAEYSSRGPTIDDNPKPDVVSPGSGIISLRSPGSTLDKQNKSARVGSKYLSLSGTSMATPICSGVIALLLEKNPMITPDEIKNLIINHANPLLGVSQNAQGEGLINAIASL